MEVNYLTLFIRLAHDVDLDLYTRQYCIRRIKSEGITFLTVTLPKLSKSVLRSLELGSFDRSDLTCFAWKGGLLRYFRGYLTKIFDKSGKLLPQPDALAIYCLRQLCEYFYKLALPFSEDVVAEAEDTFVAVDNDLELSKADRSFVERLRIDFENNFSMMLNHTEDYVFKTYPPRPGSGTFSGKTQRWFQRKFIDGEYHPSLNHASGFFRGYKKQRLVRRSNEPDYSEVLFVPKDSRGPRTIVREPFLRLKAQLSFFDYMVDTLQYATNNRIMFRDQAQNRELACKSSIDKKMCTIDLKSASDRVCFALVLNIFRNSPAIRSFLLKYRTNVVKLPDGSFHSLKKVAGMGSGLTFPLMSFLIYLVSVRTVADYFRIPWKRASMLCYTYGDDLIAPSLCFHDISANLQKCLLEVNSTKSYYNSHFRESCGGDYYAGQDVTPVRLKLSSAQPIVIGDRIFFKDRHFALLNIERHCRELVKAGILSASDYLYQVIEKSFGRLPQVSGQSRVIGRYRVKPEDVVDNLEVDSVGHYKTLKCLVAVPRSCEDTSYDPSSRLGFALKRTKSSDDDSSMTCFSDPRISIPRKICIKRVNISSIDLY